MIVAVALDLGTTTIKAGLLSHDGTLGSVIARPAPRIAVYGGRYESDASAYAATADAVLSECLTSTDVRPLPHQWAPPHRVAGAGASHFLPQTADSVGNVLEVRPPLGLSSQRSSFLIWDRASGQPVTPLVSWQDDRGAESCTALREHEGAIRQLTGLPLTPYYLAPKLRVLLRENPSWRERLRSGEWLLGTLDSFLVWRWTEGREHVTDVSMAARTLLMDVHTRQWSPVLCGLFDIPQLALPQIKPSSGLDIRLRNGLLLQASVGDQSAALIASIAAGQPEALVNLGTGGFVACYLPQHASAPDGYLQTLVWQDPSQPARLAVEGTLNSIAAALAPYPVGECHVEELASDGIFCLAEPSGLGAPYFRSDLGLAFSEPVEHLAQQRIALLLQEAIIFRVARILEDFRREFGIERVYLSGGLSGLPCLQEGIARCAPCTCYRLLQAEASLNGAAHLAAGLPGAGGRMAQRIDMPARPSGLPGKYAGWKDWLDGLLGAGPSGQVGRRD